MKGRPQETADQAAARAFLARHHSLRVARLGELVHPLDHPAFVAEAAGGHLQGVLTYVPGMIWRSLAIARLARRCRGKLVLTKAAVDAREARFK